MKAIIVDKVSKRFRIPTTKKATMFQYVVGFIRRQYNYDDLWALKDVSFELERGEAFGIIGKNGSGKSTMMKILTKIMPPDTGSVTVNGKVAAFLGLGVGFQPELSARDNVYLYSSILGIGRKVLRENYYDAIFDFAELKQFENVQLKNFSSGMTMRLAFATAIYVDPEIMLLDEVLAVGDEAFQEKCASKINEFREQGKTIILVSHSINAVKNLCPRSMLLSHGRVVSIGDTDDVVKDYIALKS